MLKIGLKLTKNPSKYYKLLNLLKMRVKDYNIVDFIFIKDNNNLKEVISKLDILVTYEISEELFNYSIGNLKWIHLGVSGVDKSLSKSIRKSKTIITNSRGINSEPVSEYVIGMMLYLSKKFNLSEKFKNNKKWDQWALSREMIQLNSKTVGIIGYGAVGKKIAKKCKAFNMKLIITKRSQKEVEVKKSSDVLLPITELNYLLKNSDYIIIACPLTNETVGLIGKSQLEIMKSTAFLINIARGKIINEFDLINALKNNIISGAALDVYENEPLEKRSKLFNLNNVFLSPHISGNFPEYQYEVVNNFSENLNRYINNKYLKNRICKKKLY